VELFLLKFYMMQKYQRVYLILVNGMGPIVGAALSEHPDIDMMHFTGSREQVLQLQLHPLQL
jgi:acyl-CoA reductase-like NAD-dependent aldehyde dehydrogenase